MKKIDELLREMTLEEKASLCSGDKFWSTKELENHSIPSMMLSDGPHGLRKQTGEGDHLGINKSLETTCFPTAAGLAASWNRELITMLGETLGEECQAEKVQVILGPGANIKRSPLCGRNFEYYSEDPYLSSELATQHILGVQSKGIGTSLKHFAVNNQETRRFNIDVEVDERTLREIYLASFEGAVIKGKPWTVMAAYNKINGEFCSQNKRLLTEILRDEWGFEGFVVSDWFAVSERDKALHAGLDLEMPTSGGIGVDKILSGIKDGTLKEEQLDASVERILKIIEKSNALKKDNATYDKEVHHHIARDIASESIVLLKNENDILPLSKDCKIGIFGPFAKSPRFQGAGSSKIIPTFVDIPFVEINKKLEGAEAIYSEAFSVQNNDVDELLTQEALAKAQEVDYCLVFMGLTENMDCEGADRSDLSLPRNQNIFMEHLIACGKPIIVVLHNGSAVEMPWYSSVDGIFEAYLGGQAMGGALADLLFGDANPSAKLAETFPMSLKHTPSYINFPGDSKKVCYKEGIFIGYRHYDKLDIKPQFSFGFGLSYTEYEYSQLEVNRNKITDQEILEVSVLVKNIGHRRGKEIVQLYVRDVVSDIIRPVKELKGFDKVELNPGETKKVSFQLDKRAFAYYNTEIADWHVESGEFEIQIGKSSNDIVLSKSIEVESTVELPKKYTIDSTIADIRYEPAAAKLVAMLTNKIGGGGAADLGMDMNAFLSSVKVQSLVAMSRGMITMDELENLLDEMNR